MGSGFRRKGSTPAGRGLNPRPERSTPANFFVIIRHYPSPICPCFPSSSDSSFRPSSARCWARWSANRSARGSRSPYSARRRDSFWPAWSGCEKSVPLRKKNSRRLTRPLIRCKNPELRPFHRRPPPLPSPPNRRFPRRPTFRLTRKPPRRKNPRRRKNPNVPNAAGI